MTKRIMLALVVASILSISSNVIADTGRHVAVSPFFGVGLTSTNGDSGDGVGTHTGLRLLLSANKRQRYGIELGVLDLYAMDKNGPDIRYAAIGLIVEQTLWDWFLMSIGTIGYVGMGDNNGNPFGIRSSLGWQGKGWLQPFVSYRGDTIFDVNTISMHSVSAGFRMAF
ncbi:MAG: hypothetical protein GXO96_02200 [Nitrospirae bacterium]|nr:hypothetical protein [Candidatus Manganitrophaceae bacterium]